ncbi:MAG TPA: formylglycine-generating enzyme family protein [Gemmataceae bacterium]|nr:formylglycine-generating enzyme family protein [Gemmataceae bacterium]
MTGRVLLGLSALAMGSMLAAGDRDAMITNAIGMKLALIPAGRFSMGSPADEAERDTDEAQHEIVITTPFYMGVHEVTQREYERVMGKNPSFFHAKNGGSPDHPVDQVLWGEAVEFCTKLSALPEEKKVGRRYRLPTEAEWEYACRAATKTAFHFGNTLSSRQANFNGHFPYGMAEGGGTYLQKTAKVGSYQPNAFGLSDMHGNVAEWCSDWYDPEYYRHSPKEDPRGPAQGVVDTGFGGFYHVVRGGSWLDEGRGCRAAYRFRFMPSDRYRLVGFRVVGTPIGPGKENKPEEQR